VAQLIVRNVAPAIVRELKLRAARRGRSAEAEHRDILRAVGEDADFQRPRDLGRRTTL
jgi:plasmid stability protein